MAQPRDTSYSRIVGRGRPGRLRRTFRGKRAIDSTARGTEMTKNNGLEELRKGGAAEHRPGEAAAQTAAFEHDSEEVAGRREPEEVFRPSRRLDRDRHARAHVGQ